MLGEVLEDRYRVEEHLGAGAMGHVYRATHVRCGRQVAIKVMHDELARVPVIVERFAREALIAAKLQHRNVVGVLDVGTTAQRAPFIVLEYAPGRPLSEYAVEPLPADTVRHLACEILRGLAYAHRAGFVHRDLKPDNILVEQAADGTLTPRIVDFGIATLAVRDDSIFGRRLTDVGVVIGTPVYMAPEQATGKELDHRADLFAMGVIMYELLAGVAPFEGTTVDVALANVSRDAPRIRERAGIEVDPELERITRKLMARKRENRYQSAEEVLADLAAPPPARVEVSSPTLTMPAIPPVAERYVSTIDMLAISTHRRRWPVAVALAAAVAAVAVVATSTHAAHASAALVAADVPAEPVPMHVALAAHDFAPAPVPVHVDVRRSVAAPRIQAMPTVAAFVALPPAAPPMPSPRATAAKAGCTSVPVLPPPLASGEASANDVVAHYKSAAHALHDRPVDDQLWIRFRRIRLDSALTDASSRRAAVAELDAIEHAAR